MSYINTKSKNKIGPGTSRYRLYVRFKVQFRSKRKDFNYFSDDRVSPEHGLKLLLKRVLNGSCKDRYELAMLYETSTNTCIKVFTPWLGETSFEAFQDALKQMQSKTLFKAYVVCIDSYIDILIQNGKPHPITIPSNDVDLATGNRESLIAFQNFHKLIIKGELKGKVNAMHIYDRQDQRVAIFSGDGAITFLDESLKKGVSHFFKSIH